MKLSQLQPQNLTDNQITQIIFDLVKDDGEKGDCLFVFGSSKAAKYRLPRALQLYYNGRAPKILVSGGAIWDKDGEPEAMVLKNKAMEQGVPEEDILIEAESLNTKENVLASLMVLDRYFELHKIKRILIVTGHYHMLRAYLTMKTYMPDWIDFSLCPADDTHTQKESWYRNEISRKRVRCEFEKLIHYIKIGALEDMKIPDI